MVGPLMISCIAQPPEKWLWLCPLYQWPLVPRYFGDISRHWIFLCIYKPLRSAGGIRRPLRLLTKEKIDMI